jgi:uridylate kinase
MVAASIVARSKIVLHFVDGSMPQTIRDVLEGKRAGTTVQGKI